MELVSIVFHNWSDNIDSRMKAEIEFFERLGIRIKEQINNLKEDIFVTYALDDEVFIDDMLDDFISLFRYRIADALSDIILKEIMEKLIYDILRQQYCCFNSYEKESILKHFKQNEEDRIAGYHRIGFDDEVNEKSRFTELIADYLQENSSIHLEGFFRFRLKDDLNILKYRVDRAVEDFLMEREYNEFIKLLRYFVELQEPKVDTIHLFMSDDEKYLLYDKEGKIIKDEELDELSAGMKEKDMNDDDLLISSLITLAPTNLVIHFTKKMENKEIIETIKRIFIEKISICNEGGICIPEEKLRQE